MHLHGSAQEALQQRVVQFLSDTGALSQTLIEAGIDARSQLPNAQPVQGRQENGATCNAQEQEPSSLKPGKRNVERQCCTCLVPNAIVIAGNYLELVPSRAEASCSTPDGVCLRFAIPYPRPPACSEKTRARE